MSGGVMGSIKKLIPICVLIFSTGLIWAGQSPDSKTTADRKLNLRAYTELLRADVKAKRVAIITEIMQFDDAEAATFWPIFREYDLALSKIGDERVRLIEDYIKN